MRHKLNNKLSLCSAWCSSYIIGKAPWSCDCTDWLGHGADGLVVDQTCCFSLCYANMHPVCVHIHTTQLCAHIYSDPCCCKIQYEFNAENRWHFVSCSKIGKEDDLIAYYEYKWACTTCLTSFSFTWLKFISKTKLSHCSFMIVH